MWISRRTILIAAPAVALLAAFGVAAAFTDDTPATPVAATSSTVTTTTTSSYRSTYSTTSSSRSRTTTSDDETTTSRRSTTRTTTSTGSRWADVLPGAWKASHPAGGDELYSFNGKNRTVSVQYYPGGLGTGNPLNNGRPAPIYSYDYSVSGSTLTLTRVSTRTYRNLRSSGNCFLADSDGGSMRFCRYSP
ncbi:hypothetical protein D5S17_17075 [Pseudonocardiaceae bacterium YIM PH 21723]|nr:hypothetical protein D5S17_17075 [Pseudonocardiaceae bacterium YIM PH 21723]